MPVQATDQEFLKAVLGLSEEEAFLLLRILARGQMTAAAAARVLEKSRGRAYEVLRRLVEEGLLEEKPGRPLQFRPRPLQEAVTGKRAELEARLAAVRDMEQRLRAPAPARAEAAADVSLVWGARALHKEAVRMARAARANLVVAARGSFLADSGGFHLLLASAAEASARGTTVRFYMADSPDSAADRQQVDAALGVGHIVPFDPKRMPDLFLVASDDDVLQGLPGAHGEWAADDALGVKVRGPRLPEFMRRSLQAFLGPGAGSVEDAFSEFKSVLAKATLEVSTMAGQGWRGLWPAGEVEGLGRRYQEAGARGVRLRTLVHDAEDAALLGNPGNTRVKALQPMWMAVVDDAVVFQVRRDEAGEVTARLSTDASVVRLFQALFEHAWAEPAAAERAVEAGPPTRPKARVRVPEDTAPPAP